MAFFPDYNDILKEKYTFLAVFIIAPLLLFLCGWNIQSAVLLWMKVLPLFFCGWIWILRSGKLDPNGRAVLVSGCDSGFGQAAAYKLHEHGFTVYAGCLLLDKGGEGAAKLLEIKSDRMHVIQLDVTSEKSVEEAVNYVSNNLSPRSEGLWALINNAGIGQAGDVQHQPLEAYEKIMAVNFHGHIRMTKAFLPLLQKCNGRIVNVCSLMSLLGVVLSSAYVSSKWALKGFSECIRQELSPKGIRVITIDPGNFIKGTCIFPEFKQKDAISGFDTKDISNRHAMKAIRLVGSSDLGEVVGSMVDAVNSTYPATNYIPGSTFDKVVMLTAGLIPTFISDMAQSALFALLCALSSRKKLKG